MHGRPRGLELILPDWFYAGVLDDALVLTIDRAYFDLTGGLERWLYRVVRKHGGRQQGGWSFDLVHLHAKSGSLSPLKHFAYDLREIVRRQTLPGYRACHHARPDGAERLIFAPDSRRSVCGASAQAWVLPHGGKPGISSCYRGPRLSCHRGPDPRAIGDRNRMKRLGAQYACRGRNFTNLKSFGFLLTGTALFSQPVG